MNGPISRRRFALRAGAALAAAAGLDAAARRGHAAAAVARNRAGSTGPGRLSAEFVAGLPRLMELASVPGLAIGIVEDGAVTWVRGFGVRAAGEPDPAEPDTVFEAASLSKPVFAYAVLRLRDQGLIDLDRPLVEYLPGAYVPGEPRAARITARHVLSHTTGLPNWRGRASPDLTLAFAPGERFRYSGEAHVYLQRVVERITGVGFTRLMREAVLEPLGMRHSSYVWTPALGPRMSRGHGGSGRAAESPNVRLGRRMQDLAGRWGKPVDSWYYEDAERALRELEPNLPVRPNVLVPNAAASLLSTAADMARFLARVVGRPSGDGPDLTPAARREMLAPRVRINAALGWGLGWGLEDEAGRRYFWQWGDNGDYKAFAMGDAAARWAIVTLSNGAAGLKLCERIVNEATGHAHPAFLFI